MASLKRPDIEFFIPESDVMQTGSYSGIFDLAISSARKKLASELKMVAHQPVMSPAGYIVYAWIDHDANK